MDTPERRQPTDVVFATRGRGAVASLADRLTTNAAEAPARAQRLEAA